jgi:pimeloyl-ACP methyl ester carboxylesterase
MRLKPLQDVGEGRVPVFLIQGNRDPFFPPSAASLLPSTIATFVVDGGDHGLCLKESILRSSYGSSQHAGDNALIAPALKSILLQLRPPSPVKASKQLRSSADL